MPQRRQRIGYRIRDCGRRANRAALPHAAKSADVVGQIRFDMNDADGGILVGDRHEIIREARGDELALIVIDDLLQKCRANSLRDRAPAPGHRRSWD